MKYTNLLLFISIMLMACDGDDSKTECETPINFSQKYEDYVQYNLNYAKWECANISHYSYVFVGSPSFCSASELLVEMKDGEVIDTTWLISPVFSGYCTDFFTLADNFRFIEEAVDSLIVINRYSGGDPDIFPEISRAHSVSVSYDDQYGFPQRGIIDYYETFVDDEYSFQVKDFTILE